MSKRIIYRFEVTVTEPLTDDPDHADFYTEAGATSVARRREVERTMAAHLKKCSGDADVELMDFSVEDE